MGPVRPPGTNAEGAHDIAAMTKCSNKWGKKPTQLKPTFPQ